MLGIFLAQHKKLQRLKLYLKNLKAYIKLWIVSKTISQEIFIDKQNQFFISDSDAKVRLRTLAFFYSKTIKYWGGKIWAIGDEQGMSKIWKIFE